MRREAPWVPVSGSCQQMGLHASIPEKGDHSWPLKHLWNEGETRDPANPPTHTRRSL